MTTPDIDTASTLEIAASPYKMLALGLGSAAFAAVAWFMSRTTENTGRYSAETAQLIGWAGLVFFGLCAILIFWRLFTQRGTVVTLSPQGLRDIRVSPDVIAWPAIERLFTWSHSGQKILIAALKPGEEQKLKLTAITRMTRGANAKLGADGLPITVQGLKIKYPALLAAAIAYAERYGGDASAPAH